MVDDAMVFSFLFPWKSEGLCPLPRDMQEVIKSIRGWRCLKLGTHISQPCCIFTVYGVANLGSGMCRSRELREFFPGDWKQVNTESCNFIPLVDLSGRRLTGVTVRRGSGNNW